MESDKTLLHRFPLRMRYLRVTLFFTGMILSIFLWDILLRHLGLRSMARRTAERRYKRHARRFRILATRLGGLWIKVGQFLSTRLDVLPDAVTDELAGLQDEVPSESFDAMRGKIESSFGRPLEECFQWVEAQPLASASLGQVHRARLPAGDEVVVKVQRPGIRSLIKIDMDALQTIVRWIKRYPPISRRVDLDAIFAEFSQTVWQEVDYVAEAENARRFAEMFAGDANVRIPKVYAQQSTKEVLVLEDVYFIKITDYAAIEEAGVELEQVARRLLHTYFHQIFDENFFHADPHPGNLFVEPLDEGKWRLVFVDFGMVGRITPEAKAGLRDALIAIGTGNVDRMMQAYQRLGVLLPSADIDRIREVEEAMLSKMWGKSMREIIQTHPQEMREIAHEYRDVLYEMPFQVPSDLLFLGRCISILMGMCVGLDPDFNFFENLRPFAEGLLTEETGDWINELIPAVMEQIRALAVLPARMEAALSKIERGEVRVTAKFEPEVENQIRRLAKATNRIVGSVVFAALLLTGSIFYINGEHTLGGVCFGLGGFALLLTVRG
jgi:predicted unusual protein kinase regulating ubiquinone biosynthesis (AarF/ABC1/UbiB family)